MINHVQDKEGRALARRVVCLRATSFFGLGAILAMLCLLCGCGSDSKPAGSVSGKKEKSAQSSKAPGALNLMVDKNTGSGNVKKAPVASDVEIQPGAGVTVREVIEWADAARKRTESPTYEVLPGLTREKLEAIEAAEQKRQAQSPKREVLPGLTREDLEARAAADRKMTESPTSEVLPGITRGELETRIAADRAKSESPNQEVLPGITKDQLDNVRGTERK